MDQRSGWAAVSPQRGPHLGFELPSAGQDTDEDMSGDTWCRIIAYFFSELASALFASSPFRYTTDFEARSSKLAIPHLGRIRKQGHRYLVCN